MSKYTLTYHLLGHSDTKVTTEVCVSIVDAINLTMSKENHNPILFDYITSDPIDKPIDGIIGENN